MTSDRAHPRSARRSLLLGALLALGAATAWPEVEAQGARHHEDAHSTHPVAITYPLPPPPVPPGLMHAFLVLYAEYVQSAADEFLPFGAWLLRHGVSDRETFQAMMHLYRWMATVHS